MVTDVRGVYVSEQDDLSVVLSVPKQARIRQCLLSKCEQANKKPSEFAGLFVSIID